MSKRVFLYCRSLCQYCSRGYCLVRLEWLRWVGFGQFEEAFFALTFVGQCRCHCPFVNCPFVNCPNFVVYCRSLMDRSRLCMVYL